MPSLADLKTALRWYPDGARFRLFVTILLSLFAAYAAIFLELTATRLAASPPSGDFFALWSAARLLLEHSAPQVYDAAALKTAQLVLGMDPGTNYPFPYPPTFLLALAPLGLLALPVAYAIAMAGTLGVYLWATAGSRWRWPIALGAALAPTTTITIVAGQAGLLMAGLLAGGFRLASRRPVAAGVLFGLATYKPQLGMLVPVALVAAGLWRVIAAGCATVAVLAAVTALAFGPAIWPAWAANIAQYVVQFAAESSEIAYLMPTVTAALTRLGAPPAVINVAQIVSAAIAIGAVWRCFRRGPTSLAAAALFVATLLATPHAFVYDMPLVTTAVLWFIVERADAGATFDSAEILVMTLAMIAPIALVAGPSDFPLALVSLILLLAIIVRRIERRRAP